MKERSFYKEKARRAMQGTWVVLAIAILIQTAIAFVVSLIPAVGAIAAVIIAGPFSYALAFMAQKILKGDSVSVENVFDGFKDLGRTVELAFRQFIVVFLWSLLFVIPGIIKGFSYSMVYFIIADHPEYTPKQAMEESKELMQGHRFELFLLELSFLGWNILSVFTFGILSFWVMPYMHITTAAYYEDLKKLKYGEQSISGEAAYCYGGSNSQAPSADAYSQE